jgi:Zn-dependent protease
MRIFGIPISIHPSFFILTVLLAFSRLSNIAFLIEWVLVVLVSIVFHELGHAVAVKRFGGSPQIELYAMGGLTSWSESTPLSPLRRIVISLSGPGVGFLVSGIVYAIGSQLTDLRESSPMLESTYFDLLWVNFGWGILNLLPILPLDGGAVVRSFEELITKRREGIISHSISLLTALGLAVLSLMLGLAWTVFLSGWFAFANGSALVQILRNRADRRLGGSLEEAQQAIKDGDAARATMLAQEIVASSKSPQVKHAAGQLLVHGYIQQGKFEMAREELRRITALYGEDPYLEGHLLLSSGNVLGAINHLELAFNRTPSSWVGFLLAQALTQARRFDEAMALASHPVLGEFASSIYKKVASGAFEARDYEVSASAGKLAFERLGDSAVAYNVACALARSLKREEAVEWLSRAVQAGFKDVAMLTDADLRSLRGMSSFDELCNKIANANV